MVVNYLPNTWFTGMAKLECEMSQLILGGEEQKEKSNKYIK
jgi:hypothetical protein